MFPHDWALQVDNEIVTIEIPEALVKQWNDKPEFRTFYDDFVARNPPAKTFKGATTKASGKAVKKLLVPPSKRKLAPDLSSCLVALDEVPQDDTALAQVALINGRSSSKLTTMPLLMVGKKLGPYIRNETGEEVVWQWSQNQTLGFHSIILLRINS